MVFSLPGAVSDNLARYNALASLVNEVAEEGWDDHAPNRISAIHFLEDGEDDDDREPVRGRGSC